MNISKQQLEDFLSVSLDKLQSMGACEPGQEWFYDTFGDEVTLPLIEVVDRLPIKHAHEWFQWYCAKNDTSYGLVPFRCKESLLEEIYELECLL